MNHRSRSLTLYGGFALLGFVCLCAAGGACLSSPGAAECNGPRRYGFIVHGLWPQYAQGWPENCGVHVSVPDGVVQGIADLMPARACSANASSGTCRAPQVIIPPIR